MLDSRLRVKLDSLFRELTGFFLHPLFHRLFPAIWRSAAYFRTA